MTKRSAEGPSGPRDSSRHRPSPTVRNRGAWWRSLYHGPVSGRYEKTTGRLGLQLRVDVDPIHANSRVTECVSGDFFEIKRVKGREPMHIPRDGWVVAKPRVAWMKHGVEIGGRAHVWRDDDAPARPAVETTVGISIPWHADRPAGPAKVTFRRPGYKEETYICEREDAYLRAVTLEVDVAQSVSRMPSSA